MISLHSPYDHSFIRSKFKHTDSPIYSLTCWYTNADSLINKLDELKSRILLRHPDIICVSEVFPKHCSYDVTVAEFCIDGYDCFYSIFSHDVRGVCIYVKSKYKAHKVETLKIPFREVIWCSISFKDTESFLLGVVYRSLMSSEANDVSLMKALTQARNFDAAHLLIVGDFNFPRVNWSNWSSPEGDVVGNNFLEALDDLLLFQHVDTPTRKHLGQLSSILNLVLSDEEYSVSQMVFLDPLGRSDHCMIESNYLCYTAVEEPHFTKYLYVLGNYQDFVAELLKV